MILETKLFPLHGYCLWSLQALENYIWVAKWVRLFSLFLKVDNELYNTRKEMDELKTAMKDKGEENLDGMI